jgi:pullulanase/glycogen debranching enzyme
MGEKATKGNESHALESPFVEGEVLPGNALPIGGAHQSGDGVSFVLFSRHATRVHLELYQNANDSYAARSIVLDPVRHRTGDIWHVWVRGMRRLTILQTMVDLNTIHHKEGRPSRT